ncbi:MAG TPA: type III-B CRISPR-associated protein Cas10/Cmr2 [Fervidobacterium sp.]|nr:type III-B CRISPR-associated protein Cas10/Cmr2 [Fervidobacterium sp.]HOL04179.1 type III-B CRISPR-associated protein Cas10/Cmr2 [Fervidobacterium sp.]
MSEFNDKLKQFLHDPIDKCFDIPGHEIRAKRYAELFGVGDVTQDSSSDQIASCMERSFLPRATKYGLPADAFYQPFTEIRHPFSDGKLDVPEFDRSEVNKIFSAFEELFSSLGLPVEDDKKFFYLWRNLVEHSFEKFEGTELGKYIPILPADTRIPDHSIWEHLKVSSAINSMQMTYDGKTQLLQNNSLFVMSIGPVQSFISQARKTQDFFMGSFVLSYLTFRAIEKIVKEYGPTNIIYPDMHGQPLMDHYLKSLGIEVMNSSEGLVQQPTIPNRFVAILPFTDRVKIEQLAKSLEEAVRNEWHNMACAVLNKFNLLSEIRDDVIEKQNKGFPEVYWAAIPLRKGNFDLLPSALSDYFEEDEIRRWDELKTFLDDHGDYIVNVGLLYQLAYSALEKSMGARKNLRDFEQTEEYGRKCHLCGEKEGVVKAGKGNLRVGKYISATETLCTMCFTKRALDVYLNEVFGNTFRNFSFPSTAEIACSDFKKRALVNRKQDLIEYVEMLKKVLGDRFDQAQVPLLPNIQKTLGNVAYDVENVEGDLFLEERLTKKEFKDEFGIVVTDAQLNELKKKLKNLTNKVGSPSPYYAVIKLDGDNMGKWLSGVQLPEIRNVYNSQVWEKLPVDFKKGIQKFSSKKMLTPAIHASISNALRNYSLELVRHIVEEEHLGKLVYAGGDDVLAFANLQDLIPIMKKLRAAFSGHVRFEEGNIVVDWSNNTGFVEKDGRYLLTMGPKASASCGIVIAHCKAPLKMVLDKVNEMEKKAKEIDSGKDAFAISLIKHSGQLREVVCKWRFNSGNEVVDTSDKILEISRYFRGWHGWTLSNTFPYKLYVAIEKLKNKDGIYFLDSEILESELKRVIKRSLESGDEVTESRDNVAEKLSDDFLYLFHSAGIHESVDRFMNLLEVARFISKVVS